MSDLSLHIEQHGAVRMVRLNRPQALNAFTAAMLGQLRQALEAAADDVHTRCVLLTGAGRAFSAGQDLADPHVAPSREPGVAPKDIGHMLEQFYVPLALRLRDMPIPVVAAVNGVAAGAGANLALSCDLVLAGESASFIQAFSKIGLIPDCGGTWLLPRLVGRAKALELALLGDKVQATEAERIGLIARVVPDAELLDNALAAAQRLAGMPTQALVATRRALDAAMRLDYE
ncbi:MAG: 2-(1,2-epoxy-1,2-dihydrophenyl)acetyl-CoA isomerase, partial [Rubrivivax sp.]